MARTLSKSLFTTDLILPAIGDALRKLDPRQLIGNPVMFTTAVVAALLTLLLLVGHDGLAASFKMQPILAMDRSTPTEKARHCLSSKTVRWASERELAKAPAASPPCTIGERSRTENSATGCSCCQDCAGLKSVRD